MKNVFFYLLFLYPYFLNAQSTFTNTDSVFVQPSLPGYADYIKSNLVYPKKARQQGLEGSILIMCIIDTTGSVTEAQIIKGVHPLLDDEALRIINGMPHWNPALLNGKRIKSRITIPIRFSLEN